MSNYLRGCDLSHWNDKKQFEHVFNYADFFILKATEGKSYIDPTFKERFLMLRSGSKCVGAYHFYKQSIPLKQQYTNIIKNIDGFNFPYFLDVEERNTKWSDVFTLANMLTNYYGRRPIIYTNYSMYITYKGSMRTAYNWWIARYNTTIKPESILKCNVVMWQYDDKSSWNGKTYTIDGDYFNGTYLDFMNLGK